MFYTKNYIILLEIVKYGVIIGIEYIGNKYLV